MKNLTLGFLSLCVFFLMADAGAESSTRSGEKQKINKQIGTVKSKNIKAKKTTEKSTRTVKEVKKDKISKKNKKLQTKRVHLVKRKALHVLTLEQAASLNIDQRISYINHMRRAYDLAEKIEIGFKKSKKSADNGKPIKEGYEDFWSLILGADPAHALSSSEYCINYGHILRRGSDGSCNIQGTRHYNPQTKQVNCGPSTGLRGEYAWVNYYDSSPTQRSTAPYGTYAHCGGVAKALREALTSNSPINTGPLSSKRQQVERDRALYQATINEYRQRLDQSQNELNSALTRGDRIAALSILHSRKDILDKISHLSVVPEVEAHQLKLAAEFKRVAGSIPPSLNFGTLGIQADQFDSLAQRQKIINRLGNGERVDKQDLEEIGFSESVAASVAQRFALMSAEERKREGQKLLAEQFKMSPDEGIYTNYSSMADKLDSYYSQIMRYCTGPSSAQRSGRAYNQEHVRIACNPSNPNVKDCEQYTECLFFMEESGGSLTGGRFKDVMDAYINIRDRFSSICHSLPQKDSKVPPVCVLENDPNGVPPTIQPIAEPAKPEPAPIQVVVVEEPKPTTLARNESFGCSRDEISSSDPISHSATACAVCSLSADARVLERLEGKGEEYTNWGVSKKWLTLLEVLSKSCGEANYGESSYNVLSLLKYAQVFGHCSAQTYDWSSPPYGDDADFIRFLQENNFAKDSPANKAKLKNWGWDEKTESYMSFINKRFKSLFGFHFQKSAPASGGWSLFKGSKEPTYGAGLKDMICEDDRKTKGAGAPQLMGNVETYLNRANAESAKMDQSLLSCMRKGVDFAKNNYHPKMRRGDTCYPRGNLKPVSGEVDTAVPIIISQDQWRCAYSTYLDVQNQPQMIGFHEPWPQYGGTDHFVAMRTVPRGQDRRCNGPCDASGQQTTMVIQNQCLLERVTGVPRPGEERSRPPAPSRTTN